MTSYNVSHIDERLVSSDLALKVPISVVVKEGKEKSGTPEAEKEVEPAAKPQKKSKISEDITAELIINDILNPTADDLSSSKKK